MKFPIKKIGQNLCIAALITLFVFCFSCRSAKTQINSQTKTNSASATESQKSGESRKWIPGSYEGIEVGKSIRDDVIKKFGKTVWEGEEVIEGEKEDLQKEYKKYGGKRFMLEYRDAEKFDGAVTILYGEKDKIVRAISIYPKEPMLKDSVIKKYGEDFVELNSNERNCLAIIPSREKRLKTKNEIPSTLVYPQLGISISLNGDSQEVNRIDYLLTCDE